MRHTQQLNPVSLQVGVKRPNSEQKFRAKFSTRTAEAAASSSELPQSLPTLALSAIDLDQMQAEIFNLLKQYPLLAPKLVQLFATIAGALAAYSLRVLP